MPFDLSKPPPWLDKDEPEIEEVPVDPEALYNDTLNSLSEGNDVWTTVKDVEKSLEPKIKPRIETEAEPDIVNFDWNKLVENGNATSYNRDHHFETFVLPAMKDASKEEIDAAEWNHLIRTNPDVINQFAFPGATAEPSSTDVNTRKPEERLGFIDRMKDVQPEEFAPFLAGAAETKDLYDLGIAAYKLHAGTAEAGDVELLQTFVDKSKAKKDIGYYIADALVQLPSFMGEMVATGGIYTAGRKVSKAVASGLLKKLLKDGGEKLLQKRSVELGMKVIGAVGGGTLQAPVAGVTRIEAGAMRRMLPDITEDEAGELAVIVGNEEDLLTAITKSLGEQWVETVFEHSGGVFNEIPVAKIWGKMPPNAKNAALKMGLFKAMKEANPHIPDSKLVKFLDKASWHGAFPEVGEEVFGEGGQALLQTFVHEEKYTPPSKEQAIGSVIAILVAGGGFAAFQPGIDSGTKKETIFPPDIEFDQEGQPIEQESAEKRPAFSEPIPEGGLHVELTPEEQEGTLKLFYAGRPKAIMESAAGRLNRKEYEWVRDNFDVWQRSGFREAEGITPAIRNFGIQYQLMIDYFDKLKSTRHYGGDAVDLPEELSVKPIGLETETILPPDIEFDQEGQPIDETSISEPIKYEGRDIGLAEYPEALEIPKPPDIVLGDEALYEAWNTTPEIDMETVWQTTEDDRAEVESELYQASLRAEATEQAREALFTQDEAVEPVTPKVTEKVEGEAGEIIGELPKYAQGAIMEDSMMRRTNEGGSIDSPDPYDGIRWKRETVSIGSLKKDNEALWGKDFTHRGSVTKGAIVVNDRGIVIDGNNRLFEAINRGDKSIDVIRPIIAKSEPKTKTEPVVEKPVKEVIEEPKKKVVTPKAAEKEPFEMTRDEFIQQARDEGKKGNDQVPLARVYGDKHESAIVEAFKERKVIPDEVKKDYTETPKGVLEDFPDLKPKVAEKKTVKTEPGHAKEPWSLTAEEIANVIVSEGRSRTGAKDAPVYQQTFIDYLKSRVFVGKDKKNGYQAMMQKPHDSRNHFHSKSVETTDEAKELLSDVVKQAYNDTNVRLLHKRRVKQAVDKKKNVPDEVLNEYPELAAGGAGTGVKEVGNAIDEIIDEKRESTIGQKEFKVRMLAEIDKAIENVPDKEGFENLSKESLGDIKFGSQATGNKIAKVQSDLRISRPSNVKDIKIHIPGDGTFTIANYYFDLLALKNRVAMIKDIKKAVPPKDRKYKKGKPLSKFDHDKEMKAAGYVQNSQGEWINLDAFKEVMDNEINSRSQKETEGIDKKIESLRLENRRRSRIHGGTVEGKKIKAEIKADLKKAEKKRDKLNQKKSDIVQGIIKDITTKYEEIVPELKGQTEALREKLRKAGGQLNMGIDPAVMWSGIKLAYIDIKAGVRTFQEFFRNAVRKFGDIARRYAQVWWDGAKKFFRDDAGFLELNKLPKPGDPFVEIPAFIDKESERASANEMMSRELPDEVSVPQAEGVVIDAGIEGSVKLTKEPTDMAGKEIETYWNNITVEQGLTVDEAQERGIAIRTVGKKNTPTPSVRESGVFVPEEFASYGSEYQVAMDKAEADYDDKKNNISKKDHKKRKRAIEKQFPYHFKDAKHIDTKDPTVYIEEIDGALGLGELALLKDQAGPAVRHVLWRTRDISKLKRLWLGKMQIRLNGITEGVSKAQRKEAFDVLEVTSRKGAYVATEDFALNPNVKAITNDPVVVKFAQDARKFLENSYALQNKMRKQRNQEIIPFRQYYAPHLVREMVIWERAYGLINQEEWAAKPGQVSNPALPDYIRPNKPFNPRELARDAMMPDFWKETDVGRLLQLYTNTAASDIFNTSIIANNKAFAQQLESMGLRHAAQGIQDWTGQAFAGVGAMGHEFLDVRPGIRKAMSWWRKTLAITVFPLNWAWNLTVQTQSSVLTVMRTGVINSLEGTYDWFGNSDIRKQIKNNSYSYIIKSMSSGKMTKQDINRGMSDIVQLEKSKFETATESFNYLTSLIERHLTGWSVAAGYRQGRKAGLTGQALDEFASNQGAKTQSMYNMEDQPGILRSELVKTLFPFQTFKFTMYNTMKEFLGQTGVPPKTASERIGWVLRFWAGTLAGNIIAKSVTGREPWEVWSLFPFADQTLKPAWSALMGKDWELSSGRGLPAAVGVSIDLGKSLNRYLRTGDTRKLRIWLIKYLPGMFGIPGGTQMSRTADGIIAIANGGIDDSAGRMMFPISKTSDQVKAVTTGVWSTSGGKEYIEKLDEKQKILPKLFKKKSKPIQREIPK